MKRLSGFALVVLLAGCSRSGPPPSPAVSLPSLRRPVVRLDQPVPSRPALSQARADVHGHNLLIPGDAVTRLGGLPGVFVLGPDGVARFRLVKIAHTRQGKAEILSGLSGHETLVLGPFADLHDGSPIVVEPHQ